VRAESAPEEAPDLSPVPAPTDLFLVGRFKSPRQALETLASWAKYPFKLHDILASDLKPLETMIAWDAPVEMASALDEEGEGKVPEPLAALSFGVTSVDAVLSFARAQGWHVQKTGPGIYRLGDDAELTCTVARALGAAPARVVCAHRSHDLDGLFPYMTRGLPLEPLSTSDFYMELRVTPIKRKYSGELASARMLAGFLLREVQRDSPRLDRALSDCVYGLVDEAVAFIADFDTFSLDAKFDAPSGQIVLGATAGFGGTRSWLVQNSVEMAQSSTPDAFWQLPAAASAGTFSAGFKPGRIKPLGRSLAELLAGYLQYEKVSPKVRDQWQRLVQNAFDDTLSYVSAKGDINDIPSDPALAIAYNMFGWQLVGTNVEAKHYQSLLDDLGTALANPELAALLKTREHVSSEVLPKLRGQALTLKGFKPGARAYDMELPRALVDALATYHGGSKLPAPKGGKAKGFPFTILVASDDDRTWLAYSPDPKAARAHLESLHDPGVPRLASRAGQALLSPLDLSPLKAGPATGGGFFALKSLASPLRALTSDEIADRMLNSLPHHGETAITFLSTVHPGAHTASSVQVRVPRAVIEDVGALIPALALLGDHQHLLSGPLGVLPSP
jgi:hypothetical protein